MLKLIKKLYRFLFFRKMSEEKIHIFLINNSDYFDKKWYIKEYNLDNSINAAEHYLKEGWKKNYNPSKMFSTEEYLKSNNKVTICPLLDYELYKNENNRVVKSIGGFYDGNYKQKIITRFISRNINKIKYLKVIRKNKNKKILVCLHIFYYNSFKEIKEYLKNLNCYNYDLIVTITSQPEEAKLISEIEKFKKDAKIIKCENRGYDVGPFFEILKEINLKKYDVIFKLQSKSTNNGTRYVYNHIFRDRDWFLYLFESTVGSNVVHNNIDMIANDEEIGIISDESLIISDPVHKQNLLKDSLRMLKLKYIEDYKYIAGTCFAIKPKLLEKTKKLKMSIDDFDKTRRGCFSLAHIMERYICFSVIENKLLFYGNNSCKKRKKRWESIEIQLQKKSALNLLNDKRIILSDDFVSFSLEGRFIDEKTCYDEIPIKEIKREWKGEYFKLKECSPYKYLDGDVETYKKYVKYHMDNNLPVMSIERYDRLIESINNNGYDKRYPIVINGNDNSVIDGQHRACILLKKFGEDYKVPVLKVYFLDINLNNIKPYSNDI